VRVEKVDPRVLQTALLDEIAEKLLKILELLKMQIPEGRTFPTTISVTDKIKKVDFVKEYPYTPLYSFTLYNDGDGEVYIGVNEMPSENFKLYKGDKVQLDMYSPKIRFITLKCDTGKTASVRLFGKF